LENKRAGEVSPPSKSFTGPGLGQALGLRAGIYGLSLYRTISRKEKHHVVHFLVG
jgi:hypothetical protein